MEVRLLGPVELRDQAGTPVPVPGAKVRGLLTMLASEPAASLSVHRLIDALWSERDDVGATAVQVSVSKLRRVLTSIGEGERLVSTPAGYQLRIEHTSVDALQFESLVDRAREQRGDPETARRLLGEALSLWRGDPLGGIPDTTVTAAMRARLEELRRVAVEERAEAALLLGHHERLVPELETMVTEDPLRERRWSLLIRALYGSGRQTEALRTYERARRQLIDEAGVEPGVELRQLEAAVLAQDAALLPDRERTSADASVGGTFRRRGNVRHPIGACIGRTPDVDALLSLVDRHRLVTLIGPGGVGKTRLALEVAAMRDPPDDGVWWVDLAAAHTGVDALAGLQRSLGVADTSAPQAQAMLEATCELLGDRAVLLVLDNCEHLVAELAPAVTELLGRCVATRVLATSREALAVPGEAVYLVEPLAPAAAVELFEARVSGGTVSGAASAALVAEICERLDRLPLALELAAARTRHLRLEEILERLTDRFALLDHDRRTTHRHQAGLRAVAEWSYGLLDDAERIVFERLSVFTDGATPEAARAVCTTGDIATMGVEQLIARLVDKSLVVADRSGAVTRFRMLQTLSDFAAERLDRRGDRDGARSAHARWVRQLASTVGWRARTSGPIVAAVQDEDAAIRDAVGWALDADPVLALEVCDDLSPFWFGAMRVSTGWELLMAALHAAGDRDRRRRASALAWAAVFATLVQDLGTADELAAEASQLERGWRDPERMGRLCMLRALAAGYRPDGEVDRWVGEARRLLSLAHVPVGLGHVDFAEGAGRLVLGDLTGAASSLRSAIDVFRREGDHLGLVLALSRLGELAWRVDDLELFAATHADLLELGRSGRAPGVVTGATARLALARLRQDRIPEAQRMAADALASCGDSFMPVINGYALRTAGLVDLHAGHVSAGRDALRAAVEAFAQGAGTVGVGQAALCLVDLSRSLLSGGELDDANQVARSAESLAEASGDPWVVQQITAHLTALRAVTGADSTAG